MWAQIAIGVLGLLALTLIWIIVDENRGCGYHKGQNYKTSNKKEKR